jgi:signal transduction histidine kinase
MESFVERVAQLAEAEAIAVLEAVPATQQGHSFRSLATRGSIALIGPEVRLGDPLRSGRVVTLTSELVARLGFDSRKISCLAAAIPTPDGAGLRGVVIMAVQRRRSESQRVRLGVDLLVDWATHEIHLRRELKLAKALSARHVQLQEQERRNLATRIHDDLSQGITVIRLAVASLERQVQSGSVDQLAAELKELTAVLRQTAQTVQELSRNLQPAMLDTLGPLQAIRKEASVYQESTGIPVECHLEDIPMAGLVSVAAFRIVEQSLSNIARHAQATRVAIRLHPGAGAYLLEVEDNGRGFDTIAAGGSLGLLGMAERAEMAGGRLSIDSRRGEGTKVIATFPVQTQPAAEIMEGHS